MQIYLEESPFHKNVYYPRVSSYMEMDEEKVLHHLSRGTAMGKEDIRLVLNRLNDLLEEQLPNGYRVHLPMGSFYLTPYGKITDTNRGFRPIQDKTHGFRVEYQSRKEKQGKYRAKVEYESVHHPRVRPFISHVTDLEEKDQNTYLVGDPVVIKGQHLKLESLKPRKKLEDSPLEGEGLFLVDSSGGSHQVSRILKNTKGRILFLIPPVPTGEYILEVRAFCRTKTLKSNGLNTHITVVWESPDED
jgi:hypothetical protein